MRNEAKIMDLILGLAKDDARVRAVYMNGSRTNPNVPKDIFQDYDIVYVVEDLAKFLQDKKWLQVFGDILIMQEPDKVDRAMGQGSGDPRCYTYLMLFTDGNRIDLRLETETFMLEHYGQDSLTRPLLDKDSCLPKIAPASDEIYHVKKPSQAHFTGICNEYWWCLQNVAKGIWRDELPFAMASFNRHVRDALDQMVAWWIGSKYDYQISVGKMGKYFKTYLPEEYWHLYQATYAGSDYENLWASIFVSCDLFSVLAKDLAQDLAYRYDSEETENMLHFLQHVRKLPADARTIY